MKHIEWRANFYIALGAIWTLWAAGFGLDQVFLWGAFVVLMGAAVDVFMFGILFRKKEPSNG